jgi:hypothetical protein
MRRMGGTAARGDLIAKGGAHPRRAGRVPPALRDNAFLQTFYARARRSAGDSFRQTFPRAREPQRGVFREGSTRAHAREASRSRQRFRYGLVRAREAA